MKVKSSSRFTGGLFGLIGISFLAALLSIFTLTLGTPWAYCMVQRWYTRHMEIDGKQLYFDGKGHQLLGKCIWWLIVTVLTLGLFILWYPIVAQKWVTKHTHFVDEV